jgi:branched-chain amino acid transport system ATP-binding protein
VTATDPIAVPTTTGGLLELDHVSAGYGPFRAVFDVSFAVREGTALALLGPNGAGKTTIARLCTGLIHPTSGHLRFEGDDIGRERPHRLARRGIVHAPEGRSVFATLTVEENLTLWFRQALGRARVAAALDEAFEHFPRLGERRRQVAGTLSGGEQRMLALARVIVDPPRLLVVDELSLGLAPIVVDEVYATLGRIRAAGSTLIVVEQQVRHALALADDAVVLAQGQVRYAGPVSELGELHEILLGGPAAG